jgi:hypothetical protein
MNDWSYGGAWPTLMVEPTREDPMFRSRRLLSLTAVAFAFVLIAGCGGSSVDGGGEDPAPEDEVAVSDEGNSEADHSEDMEMPVDGDAAGAEHEDIEDHGDGAHAEGDDGQTDHDDADDHEEADHEEADHEEAEHESGTIHEGGDIPEDARVIFATINEWEFDLASESVKAGETIVFRVNNAGIFEHEFRLSNAHRIDEHIAAGHEDHSDEGGGHHGETGDVLMVVPPGGVGELVVTFPDDTTIFTNVVCLFPDHYEMGMSAEFEYES